MGQKEYPDPGHERNAEPHIPHHGQAAPRSDLVDGPDYVPDVPTMLSTSVIMSLAVCTSRAAAE